MSRMFSRSLESESSKSLTSARVLWALVAAALAILFIQAILFPANAHGVVRVACPLAQSGNSCPGPPRIHCNFNKSLPLTTPSGCSLPPRPALCLPNEVRRNRIGICSHAVTNGILPGAGCRPRPGYACPGLVGGPPPIRGRGGAPGDLGYGDGYYNHQAHRFVPLSKRSAHHKEYFAIFVVLGSLLILLVTALLLRSRYSLKQWRDGDDLSPSFRAGVAAAESLKTKPDGGDGEGSSSVSVDAEASE